MRLPSAALLSLAPRLGLPAVALLSLALLVAPSVAAQEATAWLTQTSGDVEVQRAGDTAWTAPDPAAPALFLGDRVRTGRLSRATVLLRSTERVMLSGDEVYEVAIDEAADPSSLGKTVTALARDAWNRALGRSDAVGTGAARSTDDAPPVLERLRFGFVLRPTPAVRWLAARPATVGGTPTTYRVRVSTDPAPDPCFDAPDPADTATVWTRAGLTDTTLAYPEDAPPLTPGASYYVEVQREAPDGTPRDGDWGCFTVADDSARAALAATQAALETAYPPETPADGATADSTRDGTAALLYAAVLLDQEFYTDALGVLDDAPDSAAAHRLRRYVYDEAGPPVLVDLLLSDAEGAPDD